MKTFLYYSTAEETQWYKYQYWTLFLSVSVCQSNRKLWQLTIYLSKMIWLLMIKMMTSQITQVVKVTHVKFIFKPNSLRNCRSIYRRVPKETESILRWILPNSLRNFKSILRLISKESLSQFYDEFPKIVLADLRANFLRNFKSILRRVLKESLSQF